MGTRTVLEVVRLLALLALVGLVLFPLPHGRILQVLVLPRHLAVLHAPQRLVDPVLLLLRQLAVLPRGGGRLAHGLEFLLVLFGEEGVGFAEEVFVDGAGQDVEPRVARLELVRLDDLAVPADRFPRAQLGRAKQQTRQALGSMYARRNEMSALVQTHACLFDRPAWSPLPFPFPLAPLTGLRPCSSSSS